MSGRRRLAIFTAIIGTLGFAVLLGGAGRGAADTQSGCAGKPICVSITDQAQASKSLGSDHYLADSFVLSNGNTSTPSTSTLVNLVVTVSWVDSGAATTTTEYRPALSDLRCTETST